MKPFELDNADSDIDEKNQIKFESKSNFEEPVDCQLIGVNIESTPFLKDKET